MATAWSTESTTALLSIWGKQDIQSQLDGVVRNRVIYEKIAEDLSDLGFGYSWKQCRTKVKNLVQLYRKAKKNGTNGTVCPFYDELETIFSSKEVPGNTSNIATIINDFEDDGRSTSISATQDISFQPTNSSYIVNLQISPEEDATNVDQAQGDTHGYPIPQPNISEETIIQSAGSSNSGTSSSGYVSLGKRSGYENTEPVDIFAKLARLEMEAEMREEEYEKKHMELEERIEEKRQQKEAEHSEKMLAMFASFFGQMTQMFHGDQSRTPVVHPQSSHNRYTQSQPLFSLPTHNTTPFSPTNPPQPPATSQN